MRLYRIMLVDDEAEVRESIIRKIDWEQAGFQLVGDAENGVDALEKVEILEPDIVFTDIRMPYMDGLELATRIHQSYPYIKLVIFSGFDEFEYAKQAIRLNVIEYILKPVNVDELTRILGKIKNALDDEVRRRRNVEVLRESFVKNLPILRERLLYDLIHGRVEARRIPALMKEYNVEIDGAAGWVVAQVVTERVPESGDSEFVLQGSLIPISVQKTLEELLGKYTRFTSFRATEGTCLVISAEPNATLDGIIAALSDVCRECMRTLMLKVTVGLGQVVGSLSELPMSYRESVEAAGHRAVMGGGGVIYIGDVERSYKPVPMLNPKLGTDLVSAIKFGGDAEIDAAVYAVAESFEREGLHLSQLQFYAIGIMNTLLQLAASYELDLSDIFGPQADFFASLSNVSGADGLYHWLLELCLRIGGRIHEGRSNNAQSIVEEAKRFIREHYREPGLSLEDVCGTLHISTAYFSTVFKRETGQSYVNYLTEIRLDEAIELLKHTDDKTYTIADKVGYSDPNYFSYVFKKRFGVSPTKYRSR